MLRGFRQYIKKNILNSNSQNDVAAHVGVTVSVTRLFIVNLARRYIMYRSTKDEDAELK